MKELEHILKIFHYHQVTHGGLTLVAKEIAALFDPNIDKLNKRIAFQVKASDTLLLQVREMEKEINNYHKLIEAKDELITFYGDIIDSSAVFLYVHHWKESTENIEKGRNLRDKIEQLKKELK